MSKPSRFIKCITILPVSINRSVSRPRWKLALRITFGNWTTLLLCLK